MDDTQNWLEIAIKGTGSTDSVSVDVLYHFETWEEMLTEMDECWDNDLYEFHFGGPMINEKFGNQVKAGEALAWVCRFDGHYSLAVEVPQHHGHALN